MMIAHKLHSLFHRLKVVSLSQQISMEILEIRNS